MKCLLIGLALLALAAPAVSSGHTSSHAPAPAIHWFKYFGEKAKPMFLTRFDESQMKTLTSAVFDDWYLGAGSPCYPSTSCSQFIELRATAGLGGQPPANLRHMSDSPECPNYSASSCGMTSNVVQMFDYMGCNGNCNVRGTASMGATSTADANGNPIFDSMHFTRGALNMRTDLAAPVGSMRKRLICHELLHALGVGHQAGTANSCTAPVGDQVVAEGGTVWMQPNQHDYDMVNAIHNHNDQPNWQPPTDPECVKLGTCRGDSNFNGAEVGQRPRLGKSEYEIRTLCASLVHEVPGRPGCTLIVPGNPPARFVAGMRRYARLHHMAFKRTLV